MAQLTERQIIEYELSSSTPEDKKWIKAYAKPMLPEIAALREDVNEETSNTEALYVLTAKLLLDWSWYHGEEKAPITPENLAKIDPVDFLEITDQLQVEDVMNRMLDLAKKKSSSSTSPPKPNAPVASG